MKHFALALILMLSMLFGCAKNQVVKRNFKKVQQWGLLFPKNKEKFREAISAFHHVKILRNRTKLSFKEICHKARREYKKYPEYPVKLVAQQCYAHCVSTTAYSKKLKKLSLPSDVKQACTEVIKQKLGRFIRKTYYTIDIVINNFDVLGPGKDPTIKRKKLKNNNL